MNDGLVTFREGSALAPQLTAKVWNRLIEFVRRNAVTPGPNTLMHQASGGTQIWSRPSLGRRSAAPLEPKTFFTEASSTPGMVNVSAGVINNAIWDAAEVPVNDGDTVYIHLIPVGAVFVVTVEAAAEVPDNTGSDYYTVIATASVGEVGSVTAIPLAWDYSQQQLCGEVEPGVPRSLWW